MGNVERYERRTGTGNRTGNVRQGSRTAQTGSRSGGSYGNAGAGNRSGGSYGSAGAGSRSGGSYGSTGAGSRSGGSYRSAGAGNRSSRSAGAGSRNGSGRNTGTGNRSGNYRQSGDRAGARSSAMDGRARARAIARKRRRRRQRRIMMGLMAAVLLLIVGGIFFGVRGWKKGKEQKALRAEGITSMESGDYAGAVEKFDKAMELSGKKVGKFEIDVLQYRAEAQYEQQDYAGALETWQKLLEKDSEKEEYKTGAALCMMETGAYDEALKLGVLESRVYNRMALDQIEAGLYDEALATIDKGLQCEDQSAREDLLFNQAVTYENKRDYAKALELFEGYASQYGADDNVNREITFLQSRVNGAGAQGSGSDEAGEGASGGNGESGESQTGGESQESNEE